MVTSLTTVKSPFCMTVARSTSRWSLGAASVDQIIYLTLITVEIWGLERKICDGGRFPALSTAVNCNCWKSLQLNMASGSSICSLTSWVSGGPYSSKRVPFTIHCRGIHGQCSSSSANDGPMKRESRGATNHHAQWHDSRPQDQIRIRLV